jgi:hypothetical protein
MLQPLPGLAEKSVTEEQGISQSAEIEFMAKKRTAAPPASGGVEQRAQKITSEEMRRFMPDVRASRNNIAMAAPSAA